MSFLNSTSNGKKMIDKVFKAALKAKDDAATYGEDVVVNATLGTLFDETGTFVAFDSVWGPYQTSTNTQKAKYAASIQGNPRFRKAVHEWLFKHHSVPCEIIATPGGAGAVSSTLKNMLDPGQTVLRPSLAWGPYQTMATEFQLVDQSYNLFSEGHFDLTSFLRSCNDVMATQGKVVAIINDPCHNPSGYTMTTAEWASVLKELGTLATQGPVVIVHDIAYVDFSSNPSWKDRLLQYQSLPDNVMVVIAFSLSKTFTAYGMRVGAAVGISNDTAQLEAFKDAMIYSARSIWSTVNNSIMELFATITSDPKLLDNYLTEKQQYVTLIQQRADIFVNEAKQVGLPLYPYHEGFFATIIVDNVNKEILNQRLQDNHIFLVEVNNGLRVALCSVPTTKLKGLAQRIYDIIQ